ncbi:unnamed protein product, partial [Medioppia subpectinata]
MSSYFFLVAQMCFTLFQALFTTNPVLVRIVMFVIACECAYFLTTISISASLLSNTKINEDMAHASYSRLIRVTFDKYPVELQIQLRMFIQRLSGPTIGFYCLDLFEITYTTYASIVAALGQNFLLIVDFVRSYAEVGREDDNIEYAFSQLTDAVFNTTLSAISLVGFAETTEMITRGATFPLGILSGTSVLFERKNSYLVIMCAITDLASINANLIPTQFLGPAPNGRYV